MIYTLSVINYHLDLQPVLYEGLQQHPFTARV